MSNKDNDRAKIEKNYITFQFDWAWLKDKQIIHKGNEWAGMLMIFDDEDNLIKMYGYELIDMYEE